MSSAGGRQGGYKRAQWLFPLTQKSKSKMNVAFLDKCSISSLISVLLHQSMLKSCDKLSFIKQETIILTNSGKIIYLGMSIIASGATEY